MNWTLRNVLLLEGKSVNRNEDAQVTGDPDKRAPVINRQVHAEASPDKEARTKAPRGGPHPYLIIFIYVYAIIYICIHVCFHVHTNVYMR